jgi:predicted amidohydrolase
MSLRDRLTELGLAAMLWWKSRPGLASSALAQLPFPLAASLSPNRVTVGLAQMQMELTTSAADYARHVYALTRTAVERGAQFVVFPEYTGAPLLGLLPGVQELASGQSMQAAINELTGGAQVSVGDVFRVVAPAARKIYLETFSTLARKFGIHLMAGSIILPGEDGKLYSYAHLFAPDGRLIGTQRKLHPYTIEREWLTPGNELDVFDLPFGRVAMPICMDYTYWETARLAYLKGAEILIDPAADDVGDNDWLAARGVRMRVQESPCYGLHVFIVTDLFDLHWRGRSSVYAPLGLLPDGQHVLAQAESYDREEIVVCDLDMAALRAFRAEHAPDWNVPLYEKYLPRVYGDYRANEQDERRIVSAARSTKDDRFP